jgi:Cu2+-exporting ATPase
VARAALRAGDVVRVLPGERFPVDGTVLAGACAADEASLSGEPRLVPKAPGDDVAAGAVCWEGAVSVRASAAGDASQVAGIAALVEAAQARAPPAQRLADAIAGKFVVGVVAASAATFIFWATAGAALFPEAPHRNRYASVGFADGHVEKMPLNLIPTDITSINGALFWRGQ